MILSFILKKDDDFDALRVFANTASFVDVRVTIRSPRVSLIFQSKKFKVMGLL
jgi:hypothetical protein